MFKRMFPKNSGHLYTIYDVFSPQSIETMFLVTVNAPSLSTLSDVFVVYNRVLHWLLYVSKVVQVHCVHMDNKE